MAAEYRDGASCLRQRGRNLPADASPASGDERMQGMRQSGHAQPPANKFTTSELCVYFRLQAFATNQRPMERKASVVLDRRDAGGSVRVTHGGRVSWQRLRKASRGTERAILARPGISLDRFTSRK